MAQEEILGKTQFNRHPAVRASGARYCSVCNSLPGLKRTAFPGGIETSAPVRGFRPMPVLRGFTVNTPNPRSSIRSPCSSARFIFSNTVSTAISDFVFVIPVLLTTSLMMSSLIKRASRYLLRQTDDRIRVISMSSKVVPVDGLNNIDPWIYRRTCAQFVTGITVVTTLDNDGHPHGMTVNSF